ALAALYGWAKPLPRLLAPLVPVVAAYVGGALRAAEDPDSVHLTSWPTADQGLVDERLSRQMRLARRLVELGRSARATASIQIRQPLSRALVGAAGVADLPPARREQIATRPHARSPAA